MNSMFSKKLEKLKKSIWVEFSALVQKYKPLNLGQGFPELNIPECLRLALLKSQQNPENIFINQYTRSQGNMNLVTSLANFYKPFYGENQIDPMKNIIVTVGAYESLYCAISTLIDQDDEVIVLEPFFDCYKPIVDLNYGKIVNVPLRLALDDSQKFYQLKIDNELLKKAFNKRTKAIIINSPHNPSGKVFDRTELEFISELCLEHNVICICDDVYEWLIYSSLNRPNLNSFHKIACIPGMWDRTLTIGSAGKTFGSTGLRVGWTIGPANFIEKMQSIHAQIVFSATTMIQESIAEAMKSTEFQMYLNESIETLINKKNYIVTILEQHHIKYILPEAGYFICIDTTNFDFSNVRQVENECFDHTLCKHLIEHEGLAAIPVSAFFNDTSHSSCLKYPHFIRLCFAKSDETLKKAMDIIIKLPKIN